MNLTNISVIKDVMSRNGFNFSKSLGQNFIINPDICPKIAEYGNARKGFGILEIGTGVGVLTKELALRADKVVAVEIGLKVAVCANIPYYITSPIIMMLLENNLPIESITVMVQKEAADRLCAEIGTRNSGAITVGVNYYGNAEKLFSVSRGNFMPSPNVDSAVIRINIDHERKLDEKQEKFFFSMVKAGFSQRRKTIANALSQIGIDKQNVYSALENMELSKSSRIEQLDMNQLIDLSVRLGN